MWPNFQFIISNFQPQSGKLRLSIINDSIIKICVKVNYLIKIFLSSLFKR